VAELTFSKSGNEGTHFSKRERIGEEPFEQEAPANTSVKSIITGSARDMFCLWFVVLVGCLKVDCFLFCGIVRKFRTKI
jgi:hypothetical protein